ncbi:MAG: phosphoenolpyruvate synthase [Magnetococcales bacterium]|nr:phosphoenolpyruvate synthase [Magnetococcales bacterium]NGZ04989.1 phosphoenolpyruvate synthase [Magnetococcales bacterium]
MTLKQDPGQIWPESDALRANLAVTAVPKVVIDPKHGPLLEVVQGLAGILKDLERLLLELNHPYRNWLLILPELKGFALKNAVRYTPHARAAECFMLFGEFFFQALDEVNKPVLVRNALDGLTACLDKWANLLPPERLSEHAAAWNQMLARLAALPTERLLLLVQSHHPPRRILNTLLERCRAAGQPFPLDLTACLQLEFSSLRATYDLWLDQADPIWYTVRGHHECDTISHRTLRVAKEELRLLSESVPALEILHRLALLPSYLDIVRGYREAANALGRLPAKVEHSADSEQLAESRKLRFLFHILETDGLSIIHEETLREINRVLAHLVALQQSYEELRDAFLRTFAFLKVNVVKYPLTALQCIEALGLEVFKRDNSRLVEAFLEQAVRFGFQYRTVTGMGSDWQPICNPAHLNNIRVWLNLINLNPKWCSTLLSALIINLKLSGTLIRDTDLFQKEITRLLNGPVAPVFNLVKQFARMLPVYYNEIGAEGELRDVSTELDELSQRQDRLIHFVRKACHVESTNLMVDLVEEILNFWYRGEIRHLAGLVATPILETIQIPGPWYDGVHLVTRRLFAVLGIEEPGALLTLSLTAIEEELPSVAEGKEVDRRRVLLLIRLYRLLDRKYHPSRHGVLEQVVRTRDAGIHGMEPLIDVLETGELRDDNRLNALLSAMEALKQVILSRETFPALEEIYQKRHIAVDIPSVYGRYQERKFDALSLLFRLEDLANVHLERLVDRIPEGFITRAAFFRIDKYMQFYLRALELDGISSRRLENLRAVLMRFLELNQFSFHQYLDIFRNFSEGIKEIIHGYYVIHHRENLGVIVPMLPGSALVSRYATLKDGDDAATLERITEAFMRDLIAESFGLQAFDRFIARILRILARQEGKLPPAMMNQLMTYDPAKLFCAIHEPDPRVRDLIHLGNKGFNLTELAAMGLPVPDGVITTTEYFRCREVVRTYALAGEDFNLRLRGQVAAIEEETGLKFGCARHPLLLSVRSGALISMPGMMQTIHNVGINTAIVEGLASWSGSSFFAWDNYRRFVQSWSMTFDVPRHLFTDLMRRAKQRCNVRKKREFTAEQMADLAKEYRRAALRIGIEIPDDPWEQLQAAIHLVMDSWNLPKAREYRRIMNIADDWGTAVVLQRMVYGNLHGQSGSGVFFTAHPHRKLDRVVLWGDYATGDQGEDIVGGLVSTDAISREQCRYDRRDPETCLESRFPEIYDALRCAARRLILERGWNHQEMEFTFDGPGVENLFFLQTRDMITAKGRNAVRAAFHDTPELHASLLAQGIGASGGVLCGVAVFSMEEILRMRTEDPDASLILIRYDTVPEDIREISRADGLLTARGGQTSHAAIVAARMEKTCVVGCESLLIRENARLCEVEGQTIRYGDAISIDGNRGLLYKGWHPVTTVLAGDTGL